MSTVAPNPSPPTPRLPAIPGGKLVEYDQYIDTQLRRTRGQVKIAEVCAHLMSLAVAALAFFLIVALADHWLIRGGFGAALRFALFAALVIGAGYYFVRKILPALLGRVNPVYAAQTIERSRPTLKNSLINFLLFRQKPESVPGVVYKALQEQAATGLTRVSIESAVDRTRMIHLGYVLIAFLTAFALYFVLSPKNPFVSAQRIILPWTNVPAPSRVSIQDIQPQETTVFRGQPIEISAIIDGLASGDVPQVLYTTADRQIVDRGVPLTVPQGYRHVASLPESKEGLQQDVAYRIEAGDAISGTFHVHVIDAPTIVVDHIEYKYPTYTGRVPNPFTIEHRGDIKELEGTQVTIHATANQPIKSGSIDLGCDHKADIKLKIDGKSATAGFVLALDKDRKGPLYDSYQLLITNDRSMENAQPIQHRVEVIADLAPEVAILAPEREEVSVPLDGQVTIELRAHDPDFALSGVRLKAKTDRGQVLDENLLTEAPHQGPFTTKYQFIPSKLGLKPGDTVAYQAVAADNKTPEANETATSEKRIKITAPQNPNPPPQANQTNHNNQPNNQQQDNDHRDGQSKNSENKSDKGQSKGSGQQRDERQQKDQNQGADQKQQRGGDGQKSGGQQNQDQQRQNPDQEKAGGDQKQDGNRTADQQNKDGQNGQRDSNDKSKKDEGQNQPGEGQQGKGDNSPQNGQSKSDQQQPGGSSTSRPDGSKGDQQGNYSAHDQSQNDAPGAGQKDQSGGSQNQSGSSQQQRDGQSPDSSGQPNKDQGPGTGDKGQAKGKGESAKDQSQSRAPANGQDDGSALEKILNHDPKDKPQSGQKGQPTGGQNNQPSADQKKQSADNQNAQSRDGQKGNATQTGNDQKRPGDDQHSKQQTGEGQEATDKGPGAKDQQGQNVAGKKVDATQPSGEQKQPGNGQDSKQQTGDGQNAKDKNQGTKDEQGTKPQADQHTKSDQGTAGDNNERKDGGSQGNPSQRPSANQDKTGADQSPSASRDNSNSNSGAGQKNEDGKGSPENPRDAKPRDKQPDPGSKSSEPSDPQSPGTSQHESDSRGDQGGDQSGGGQSGGGQKADKPGKGQSGQNTASDQGAGKASEQGKGEDSDKAGTDKKSDHQTGQAGTEKGNGSKSQAGQQPDSKQAPKDQQQDTKGKGDGNQGQGTNDKGPKGEQGERTNRGGGSGNSGNIEGSPPSAADKLEGSPAAPTDDPNLAYAKKATELALDRLKKALKASDNDNLLRDLGWSRADAEEFVKRQEERLQNANLSNRNDDRRRQAEDDLRSLGLRPDRTTRAGGGVTSDNTRGLSSDRRTAPPPEYAQQFKAYQQGVNQQSSGQGGK